MNLSDSFIKCSINLDDCVHDEFCKIKDKSSLQEFLAKYEYLALPFLDEGRMAFTDDIVRDAKYLSKILKDIRKDNIEAQKKYARNKRASKPTDKNKYEIVKKINKRFKPNLRAELAVDEKDNSFAFYLASPKSLMDLILLQVGNEIAGKVVHKKCLMCETVFVVDLNDGNQQRKKVCGDTCRTRLSRKRLSRKSGEKK